MSSHGKGQSNVGGGSLTLTRANGVASSSFATFELHINELTNLSVLLLRGCLELGGHPGNVASSNRRLAAFCVISLNFELISSLTHDDAHTCASIKVLSHGMIGSRLLRREYC